MARYRDMGVRATQTCVWILDLPFTSCVTLNNLLKPLYFPYQFFSLSIAQSILRLSSSKQQTFVLS